MNLTAEQQATIALRKQVNVLINYPHMAKFNYDVCIEDYRSGNIANIGDFKKLSILQLRLFFTVLYPVVLEFISEFHERYPGVEINSLYFKTRVLPNLIEKIKTLRAEKLVTCAASDTPNAIAEIEFFYLIIEHLSEHLVHNVETQDKLSEFPFSFW